MPDGSTANDLTIYDTAAENWWSDRPQWVDMLHRMVPGRLEWFDERIDWAGKEVLDLGCAGGFMAEALDERGAKVTGIDPAAGAIAAAKAHASETGRKISYDVGVGESLPYDDASFDAVVCVDVLEHVENLDRVLAEAARVLKPGGAFLFDTINRNWLAAFGVVVMGEKVLRVLPHGAHDAKMFIRPGELKAKMKAAGLAPEGRFDGLGVTGLDRDYQPTFGPIPFFTGMIYLGMARKG